MSRAIISTIGRDRPGIVHELSDAVFGLGLSIEDSRMTVLGGEFAVLMSVAGEESALTELDRTLADLTASSDTAYLFRRTDPRGVRDVIPYRVRVVAMDHPGIVQRIAGFFSSRHINIRDLETGSAPAPHTGTPIFDLTMTVEVPHGTRAARLRSDFETFCEEQDLDGTINVPL